MAQIRTTIARGMTAGFTLTAALMIRATMPTDRLALSTDLKRSRASKTFWVVMPQAVNP